jgi:hypothetical protein
MDSSVFGLIELLFVFGLVVAFGAWQLASLRREQRRSEADSPSDDPPSPDAPD